MTTVIAVFLFQDPNRTGFAGFIEDMDHQGAEIQLFMDLNDGEDYSDYIVSYFDDLKSKGNISNQYYFATDNDELKKWFQDVMSEEAEGIIYLDGQQIVGISTTDQKKVNLQSILPKSIDEELINNNDIYDLPLEQELAAKFVSYLKCLEDNTTKRYLTLSGLQLDETIKGLTKEETERLRDFFEKWYQQYRDRLSLQQSFYILHYLSFHLSCGFAYQELMRLVEESRSLTFGQRYFMWTQTRRLGLLHPDMMNPKLHELRENIYKQQVKQAQKLFLKNAKRIPVGERNKDLIVVFCNIVVSLRHAPTHTALERCYHLSKSTGKQVILVNTNEYAAFYDTIYLYDSMQGNENKLHVNKGIRYKDMRFAYYELGKTQSRENITEILEFIKQEKPYFIFQVGGASLIADLCNAYIPTAVMGVAFSKLPMTYGSISVLGRKIPEKEWAELNQRGYDKDNLIDSTFTFELQEQKKTFTKEQYGLPQDKFILCVVGIRLDYEVTDEFLDTLEKTYPSGTHVVFAGIFDTYDQRCKENEQLRQHSTFIGYCNDMLALMELCDLYVNPIRLGGGFSIIEAFAKGVPGVTTNTGDVSISSGPDFWVNDYDEMVKMILKYKNDKEFYNSMAEKAKQRVEIVTDGQWAMKELVSKLETSKYFQ